jgi:hypothetical protein
VHYQFSVPPDTTMSVRLRLSANDGDGAGAFDTFDELFAKRIAEADAFYAAIQPTTLSDDERLVQRQAFAGLLWSKQFFHYDVAEWLRGDSAQPPPPNARRRGRNREWFQHPNGQLAAYEWAFGDATHQCWPGPP